MRLCGMLCVVVRHAVGDALCMPSPMLAACHAEAAAERVVLCLAETVLADCKLQVRATCSSYAATCMWRHLDQGCSVAPRGQPCSALAALMHSRSGPGANTVDLRAKVHSRAHNIWTSVPIRTT